MFEATIQHAVLLKRILDSLKDLVLQANLDCSPTGISLQALDQSHVSLVALLLRQEGFQSYRCDRSIPLGINISSMTKILKCAGNEDSVTIQAEDDGDSVTFVFESPHKVSEFELKLMEVEGDSLAIPDREYDANVTLPASEFQRICRDLTVIGETVLIEVSKEGVKFSGKGEMGSGVIQLRPSAEFDAKPEETTTIETTKPVALSFGVKFLNLFTKATALSGVVCLSMTEGEPIAIEYPIEELGYIRYYLAPKIEEEEEQ
mmetsp:Transcript_32586/g.50562  ORF Transcript_32586/g.50562 Transcript_32586/m.50562 type:complete len:261 (-) Transcript_32586:39-821(-)